MGGILGVISSDPINQSLLIKTGNLQLHRGPNAQSCANFQTPNWHIAMSHQRLSIQDLSELGKQPMIYGQDEGVIVYNGEVYNYLELRAELESAGFQFKSRSDTEVILAALHHWGPDEALNKLNGMWAFVWYDASKKQIIIARDRFGIKPLYLFIEPRRILLASEVKAILDLAQRKFTLNSQVVGEYLIQSLLETSSSTYFEGVEKLAPGHYGIIDLSDDALNLKLVEYWSPKIDQQLCNVSEDELIEEIRMLFFDAVKLRMRSDVPVGALLSGGLDSSSIAAVMHTVTGMDNLTLLSAVSDDPKYDESPFIDIMGAHLNTPIHKVNLSFKPPEAMDYLRKLSWYNDEPIGSFSNVAHFLLMKQAKQMGVDVILSGQGADELLCGYRKYLGFYVQQLVREGNISEACRIIFSFLKQGTVINQFSFAEAKRYLPVFLRNNQINIWGERLQDFAPVQVGLPKEMNVIERQMLDLTKLSVPALAHFEDRMSMAWSREVRMPFLDYRLVEKLLPLQVNFKLKNGWTKYIFRKAMEPYLPNDIVWRKDKQGFVNPQANWIKSELRDEIREVFMDDSLIYKLNFVDRTQMLKLYEAYCDQPEGRGIYSYKDVFNPLALEIWLREFERYLSL